MWFYFSRVQCRELVNVSSTRVELLEVEQLSPGSSREGTSSHTPKCNLDDEQSAVVSLLPGFYRSVVNKNYRQLLKAALCGRVFESYFNIF